MPRTPTQQPSPGSIPASLLLRKPGGFYTDDAPDAPSTAALDELADPQPHIEPLNATANQPYTAFGRQYVPMTALGPYRRQGTASWYGRKFHGQRTTSGEYYDMFALSAAHPTLPIPSYARVTNLANHRSVIVRVNDRGPYGSGRIMDVSYAAAYKLGFADETLATVEVEALVPQPEVAVADPRPAPPSTPSVERAPAVPAARGNGGIYLQLGAFANPDNAQNFAARVKQQLEGIGAPVSVTGRNALYRIQLGPFADRRRAAAAARKIRDTLDVRAMVVTR